MKHKFTIRMIRELFARYLSSYTCNRNGYLSIWWIAKGKRFVVFKHRSHVEYGAPEASKAGHGSATCSVHYDLYDVSKKYKLGKAPGVLTENSAELTLTGRWCEAHENAVEKKIAEILDAEN